MKAFKTIQTLISKSISARQTVVGLVTAISLSFLLALFQLQFDFGSHKRDLNKDVNRILNSTLTSARKAVFNYDFSLAEEIVNDLMSNEYVASASLYDERGTKLAEKQGITNSTRNLNFLTSLVGDSVQTFQTQLVLGNLANNTQDTNLEAGTLEITYQVHLSYISLLQSTLRNLTLNIFVVVLLTFLLIYHFNRLLTKPITNLTRQLQNIDIENNHGTRLGEIYSHREDELGILNDSINSYLELAEGLIASNKMALVESKHSFESLNVLVESLPHLISVVSFDGTVLLANKKLLKCFQISEQEIIGKSHDIILNHYSKSTQLLLREADEEAIESKTSVLLPEVNWLRDNGHYMALEMRKTIILYKNIETILTVSVEITERKENQAYIQHLAYHDSLTDLPNRHLFLDRLDQALLRASRSKNIGSLIFIDLDNFKNINDTKGHETGDSLLIEVSKRLVRIVRDGDTVARLGGDEFVVCMTDLGTTAEQARPIALERANLLLNELNQTYLISGNKLTSSASLGLVFFNDHSISASDLLRHADLAMYKAKENGKNQLILFDKEMDEANSRHQQLKIDCVIALRNNHFYLVYQPQFDSSSNKIRGAEALLRWSHPTKGNISPAEFIPLLEGIEMMPLVGTFVLNEAIGQAKKWFADGVITESFKISINVSPQQFRQNNFADIVKNAIKKSNLPAKMFKLEITEGMIIDNIDHTVSSMIELRQLGLQFSIDDFGTGYSNLNYLKKLPLDELKLDQSFVRDIQTDPNDTAIVRTILAMADQLGLSTIAEGVETQEQLDLLTNMGCNVYQGYLFSPPVKPEEFEKFISKELIETNRTV